MTDPVTAAFVLGAAVTLNASSRLRQLFEEKKPTFAVYLRNETTITPLVAVLTPTAAVAICEIGERSQLDRTCQALNRFAHSQEAKAQSTAKDALVFLSEFPGYLPAPLAAEDEEGVITLFWHTESMYADIEFHGDGKFSVFTRARGSGSEDRVLQNQILDNAAGPWLEDFFGAMFPKNSQQQAA